MKRRIALLIALGMLAFSAACAAKSAGDSYLTAEAPAAAAPQMAAEELAYDAVEYSTMNSAESAAEASAPAPQAEPQQPADASARKIVYNADMTMTADDPSAAQAAVIERAAALGGYVADSYVTNDELGAWRTSATIKVPAERLDELVTAAKALGRVDDYQLSSDDITTRYYDIAARLKSAQAEEEQLLEILNRCESVEEILAVRESLARVRADIESYQGQINLWDNLTSYATLQLTVNRTPQPAVKGETELIAIWRASDVWNRMSRGFSNGARFVVNAVSALGIFLAVAIIPAAVLFLCVGLPIIIVRKRRRARAEANGEPLPPTRAEKRRAKKRQKRGAAALQPPGASTEADTEASVE